MEYVLEKRKFHFSYVETKEHYQRFCAMSDIEFIHNAIEALHLACFICFIKEIPTYLCLADTGIVHELVHIIAIPNDPLSDIQEIRALFKLQLNLD